MAQSPKQDSITNRYDSLAKIKLNEGDSSGNRINTKFDRTQSKINKLFNPNLNELVSKDKVEKKKQRRDSVQFYKRLETRKKQVKGKIDSLEKIQQPSGKYTLQLDSLNKVKYLAKKNQFDLDPKQVAKQKLDRKKQKRDSIQFYKKLNEQEKITKNKIDSLHQLNQPTERYVHQLDSLNKVKFVPHKRESLAHKADSLKSVNLSTGNYTGKLDSLNRLDPSKYTKQVDSKAADLQNKINHPASKMEGAVNEKLNLMNKEGGAGTNLPSNASLPQSQLPNTQLPNAQLPNTQFKTDNPLDGIDNPLQDQIGKTGIVNEKISDVKGLPQEQIKKVKSIDELQSAQSKLGEANAITEKAQKDVQNIAKGDLKEVKELPKAAEEQAGKLGMDELQKETGQFEQYTDMNDKLKDPESLKAEAMKQATIAIDHFAGQKEVLQGAMDKMGKLKSKYSSLNSLKDIPKRKPNEMKGKPFIERIVPGIAFQIQKSSDVLLDYNLLIGYRITGRFTAGAGWNERITIGKHVSISLADRIYGPRVFVDFKIGKGFSVRTDIEKMNTYVPSLTSNGYSTSEEYRAWVWSAFIGIKKEYQFIKKVKGTFQIMYNLYDDHNNSPYAERLNMRFGFDFPIKKKLKAKKETL
ncbi:MAG: hypothetical protein DI539_26305 [Flavobacterium psychrophilum]|nr:MAG: hypothetical protein DI539_26305 [Flavobacterium psychrophilum]